MTKNDGSTTNSPNSAAHTAIGRKVASVMTKPAKPQPTKKALLLKRLQSRKGATLKQLGEEFGWQPHTVRAAISRLRSAGMTVTRGQGKDAATYRVVA